MTSRENFLNFFRGKPYDFIPSSFDTVKFLPSMIPENVARGMVRQQFPFDTSAYGGRGFFDIDWQYDPVAKGSIDTKPFYSDIDDLERWEQDIPFPDYTQFDWEDCQKENAHFLEENQDKLIGSTIYSGFFERLISFVGFENAAICLIDDEYTDTVKAIFDKLADNYIEYIRYLHKYFRVEFIELHDDWGSQRAPMISATLHRELICPYIKKVVDACHQMGLIYEQHSCGFVEPLIPALIETGTDTWRGQPINDKLTLVREYGDRFHFAVSMQPPTPISDDEALILAKNFLRDYKDKRVWVFLHPILSEKQKHIIMDQLYD